MVSRSRKGAQAGGRGPRSALLIGGGRPRPAPPPPPAPLPPLPQEFPAKAGPPGRRARPQRWKPGVTCPGRIRPESLPPGAPTPLY